MIHVIAAIRAREGRRQSLLAEFQEILSEVRAKAGCIEYSLAVHLDSGFPGQARFDENEVIIVEKWADLAALKAHITDPTYQAWFTRAWELVASASMQIFEAVA